MRRPGEQGQKLMVLETEDTGEREGFPKIREIREAGFPKSVISFLSAPGEGDEARLDPGDGELLLGPNLLTLGLFVS